VPEPTTDAAVVDLIRSEAWITDLLREFDLGSEATLSS
jgi:hypothetical protein